MLTSTAFRHSSRLSATLDALAWLGSMAALLGLIGWSLAGSWGFATVLLLGLGYLLLTPGLSPRTLLRWMGARELPPQHEAACLTRELARRAGLQGVPRVYLLPHRSPNAFAMGRPDSATITVTDGLLACLGRRQLAGVLAHEISHLAAGDLRIMGIASAVARLTASMASVGLFLLLVNLPLLALQGTGIPWLAILLLLLAPGASLLLQLALARRREFDADRGAAELTGDPLGLAAALQELELAARRSRIWERFFRLGGARSREIPGMLRSHPATMERRKRLLELYGARLATGPAATRRASVPLSTALCTRRRRRVSRLPRELDRMLYRMSRMPVPFPVRVSIVAR